MLQNVPFPRRPRQKYLLSGPIVDPASGKGGANELLLLLMSMVFSGGVWILEGFIGVCGLCLGCGNKNVAFSQIRPTAQTFVLIPKKFVGIFDRSHVCQPQHSAVQQGAGNME